MAVYGTIICLGDSLTHGARDDYGRCYPMELSDMLWYQHRQRWACADEGVNGETSSDILRRSISVMKKYPEAYEVVLLCGTNDSKDSSNISEVFFEKNIDGIVRNCAVYNKEVLLCTIPSLYGFGAPDYSQKSQDRIVQFNEILTEIAKTNPVVKGLIKLNDIHGDHYADGVHLKHSGYVEIARRIFAGIEEKRRFSGSEMQQLIYKKSEKDLTHVENGKVYIGTELIGYFDDEGNYIPRVEANIKGSFYYDADGTTKEK